MGAGAIGCFVGGKLQAHAEGVNVAFVGRDRLKAGLEHDGLRLQELGGRSVRVRADRIAFHTDPEALVDRDVVLVCVKSGQTSEAAVMLAGVLAPGSLVVSLQNGLRNAEILRAGLPGHIVLAGIVGFNVVHRDDGSFRQATSGPLVIENHADARLHALARGLTAAHFDLELPDDIEPLQWSKLILNLNNAVSALTGAPTRDLVFEKSYRRILAAVMDEAIAVLQRAGIHTGRLGAPLPVDYYPKLLRLPGPLLRVVARPMIKIDPEARSSMWEDLNRGRSTEVDELNGEIVRLADAAGTDAPLNRRMVELVHEAEAHGAGSPGLTADALWAQLHAPPEVSA